MAVSSGVSKAQRGKSYNGSSMRKMQASMEALATQVESLVRAKGSTLADSTAKSRTASSGTVFEPKHMLSRDIDTAARYKAAGYMNLSSTVDSFDVTGENAHSHDALDIYAQQIIFLLQSNVGFTFSHLAKHQKMLMYRYFYRTNPIAGRVLDLHTDLPLSKLDFQPPANQPEIVKDFVVAFYTRVFKKINVNEFLREIVLHYWIYGEGYGCIDDYFAKHDIELQDLSKLDARMYQKSEAETKILEEVEAKYADNPSGVNVVARLEYLQRKFKNFFCVEYTGPDRIFVIPFYQISEYYENRDIRYEAIKYAISPE